MTYVLKRSAGGHAARYIAGCACTSCSVNAHPQHMISHSRPGCWLSPSTYAQLLLNGIYCTELTVWQVGVLK